MDLGFIYLCNVNYSLETDLHSVIRAKILHSGHKQYIMYQVLKAVHYIHSAGILHLNLKV